MLSFGSPIVLGDFLVILSSCCLSLLGALVSSPVKGHNFRGESFNVTDFTWKSDASGSCPKAFSYVLF